MAYIAPLPLIQLGLISQCSTAGNLTELGAIMAEFPLDPQLAKMLIGKWFSVSCILNGLLH